MLYLAGTDGDITAVLLCGEVGVPGETPPVQPGGETFPPAELQVQQHGQVVSVSVWEC